MHNINKDLPLSVSDTLLESFALLLNDAKSNQVTINFRDPDYSAGAGGFHPVEVMLEKRGCEWHLCYITDFCYVGAGGQYELAKELDFDFQAGMFQSLFCYEPIEKARDMYQVWENNFLSYWKGMEVFEVMISN
ncbi:DUF2787 domain-containing protein [Parashewanella curva]|uniref:DUF2787 domain-containing protein n=1 Tax=Parashewanella curva TaxID=2338552 RepID=A0A3L8PQU3_9GAMM|nr:DUF2787 family protein [Parashewanella curva]RLV57761.1 DUF2787 domain-containing protein [Parashewanella curva]